MRKMIRPTKVPAVLPHGPPQDPTKLPPLPSRSDCFDTPNWAASLWMTRANAEFHSLGVGRSASTAHEPRTVWACPLGALADPSPGADLSTVIWKTLQRNAALVANLLERNSGSIDDRVRKLICKCEATAKWAIAKGDDELQIPCLRSWRASFQAATGNTSHVWIRKLSEQAGRKAATACRKPSTSNAQHGRTTSVTAAQRLTAIDPREGLSSSSKAPMAGRRLPSPRLPQRTTPSRSNTTSTTMIRPDSRSYISCTMTPLTHRAATASSEAQPSSIKVVWCFPCKLKLMQKLTNGPASGTKDHTMSATSLAKSACPRSYSMSP